MEKLELLNLVELAYAQIKTNWYLDRIAYIPILHRFANILDYNAFPDYERVHNILILPKQQPSFKRNKEIDVRYNATRPFHIVRLEKMQECYIRTKGASFNLLTPEMLDNLHNNKRKGCFSVGRDMENANTILVLAHLFVQDPPSIKTIEHFLNNRKYIEISYEYLIETIYHQPSINISISIDLNSILTAR